MIAIEIAQRNCNREVKLLKLKANYNKQRLYRDRV